MWLEALERECKKTSQSSVAARLGVSGALVNQVLKGKYKGNLKRVESLVRGTFMHESLECPVLGIVSRRRCLDEQNRPFAPTNPQRVAVFQACRNGCPNREAGR